MQFTVLFDFPDKHAATEPNRRYNPFQVIDIDNWTQFKMFRCFDQLKWFNVANVPFSQDFLPMLATCPGINRFDTKDDWTGLLDQYCKNVSYEMLPIQDMFYFDMKHIHTIQKRLYERCLEIKFTNHKDLADRCDAAEWYMNKFWFVPVLGARYRDVFNVYWSQKCQHERDAMLFGKYIIDQFKEMIAECPDDGIVIFYRL